MLSTHLKWLVSLGLLFVVVGVLGLLDAVFVHQSCRWVLSDVRVCETNWTRAVPSLLVGTLGLALLAARYHLVESVRR